MFSKNPYFLLVIAMLFFSGNFVIGKGLADIIPPFSLAFLRWGIGLLLLAPFCIKNVYQNFSLWKREWRPLFMMALTGIFGFNVLMYISVHYTSSVNAAIVDAATPVIASILGFFFLKERLTPLQIVGIVLSLSGVLWIITRGSLDLLLGLSFNRGDLTMLVAVIVWAIYSIYIKQHNDKFPFYSGLFVVVLLGLVCTLPFAIMEWRQWMTIQWSLQYGLGLLYLGIFPSVLGVMCWNKAVGSIGPSRASVFFNLVPVFTSILAILFLHERLSWAQLLGGMLVLTGVYLSTKKRSCSKTPSLSTQPQVKKAYTQ